jgi:hypothetical protein
MKLQKVMVDGGGGSIAGRTPVDSRGPAGEAAAGDAAAN